MKLKKHGLFTLNIRLAPSNQINSNGFISIYFTFFITLISLFIFINSFVFYASQNKDSFRKTCITDGVNLQKEIIKAEKKLFLLNAPSTFLRMKLTALYVLLAATPPPANAAILADIAKTKNSQFKLDHLQKLFIHKSNLFIHKTMIDILLKANQTNYKMNTTMRWYLNIFSYINIQNLPRLGIRADSIGGIAPNYELDPNFESIQTVELKWQNIFSIIKTAQNLFNPKDVNSSAIKIKYYLTCKILPQKDSNLWSLKIKMDKH